MGQSHSSELHRQEAGHMWQAGPLFKRLVSKKTKREASSVFGLAAVPVDAHACSETEKQQRSDSAQVCSGATTCPATNGQHEQAQRSDSASSAHAAAFVGWAKQQSASRHVSLEGFLQEHCSAGLSSTATAPVLSLNTLSAAATKGDESSRVAPGLAGTGKQQQQQQQPEPFAPHNGWLLGAPRPACHEARIAAADGINALRATRDGEIESMLRLLCHVFEVETATVALLTGEAVFITGACGALPVCICPDRWGFCGWSFLNSHHELLVVQDMDADARFSENFFVLEPQFRLKFYVAAPLITANGHRLGTLCVMGQQPRTFDALKGQLLANLAEMLVRQLEEKWVRTLQATGAAAGLQRSLCCYSSCYLVLDLSVAPWRIIHMNQPAVEATGVDWTASYAELPDYAAGRRSKQQFEGMPLTALFDFSRATISWGSSSSSTDGNGGSSSSSWEFRLSGLLPSPDASAALHQGLAGCSSDPPSPQTCSSSSSYSLSCRLAISDGLDEVQPFYVGVPAWLALSEDNTWGRNYFFARLEVEDADGALRELNPAEQQHRKAQLPFDGDSAESLVQLAAAVRRKCAAAAAAADPAAAAAVPGWVPRGFPAAAAAAAAGASSPPPADSSTTTEGEQSITIRHPTARLATVEAVGSVANGRSPSPSSSAATASCAQPSEPHFDSSSGRDASKSVTSVTNRGTSVRTSVMGGDQVSRLVSVGLPVPGLVLGPLVGRGSYGRVYRGLLKGQPVAVKIIDNVGSLQLSKGGEPLEVALTRNLKQTGIMATLGYTYSGAGAVPSPVTTTRTASTAGAAGGAGGGFRGVSRSSAALMRGGGGGRVCWMLFEYCDKGVLADGVIRGWFRTTPNPLTGAPHLRVIALTALEVAVAMDYLHSRGILHGDLCGGNVMLGRSATSAHGFTAKVGDFGLARIHRPHSSSGDAGSDSAAPHPVDQRLANNAYGTITHMSPEVLLEGGAAFTPAADVYSWGVLLWEMLSGSRAWAGLAAPAVVCQVAVMKRGLAIPKNLPPVLDTLLRGALSPEPQARPSFGEIVEALTPFVQASRSVDWEAWQQAAGEAHAQQLAAAEAAAAAAAAGAAAGKDAATNCSAAGAACCSPC